MDSVGKKPRFFNVNVAALIALTFFLGTSEYTVIGILPELAAGFGITIAQAGSIVSIFAVAYAVGTPVLTALAARHNRFYMTIGGVAVFALSNLVCALTTDYAVFMFFRILTAVVSGALVSMAMTYAGDVASVPAHVAGVIAGVFSGFSVAAVLGVPLAAMVTHASSWPAPFIIIFAASVLLGLVLFRYLPRTGGGEAKGLLEQLSLFTDHRVTLGCAVVFLSGTATYCFYTYLTPILEEKLLVPESMLSLALLLFGAAATVSNVASGRVAALFGIRSLPAIHLVMMAFMLALPFAMGSLILGGFVIFALGVMMYLLNSPLQLHFLRVARAEHAGCVNLAAAIIPVFYNLGIAYGSAVGSVIVDRAGLFGVGFGGALFALLAALVSVLLLRSMTFRRAA